MNYKDRLTTLKLLPLMYWLELLDIMFFVKCTQQPADNFDITQYIKFATKNASSRITRSITSNKLVKNVSHYNITRHFYFNRIVRLWNALPTINY